MNECERKGKFFGGCKFEARYDIGEPTMTLKGTMTGYDFREALEAIKPKTYVHDVCVTCGKTINRSSTRNAK